ncbi:unnamed protein product, partial [Staurois parvus]
GIVSGKQCCQCGRDDTVYSCTSWAVWKSDWVQVLGPCIERTCFRQQEKEFTMKLCAAFLEMLIQELKLSNQMFREGRFAHLKHGLS